MDITNLSYPTELKPQTKKSAINCQKPSECSMSKNCLEKSVIYQATVKTSDKRPTQTYVGLTENEFKTRSSITKLHLITMRSSIQLN
jgi:hypothetical protein